MPRDMLCYCLNMTYADVRELWRKGYFQRASDRHPGAYCTGCRGDLACFLATLPSEDVQREALRQDAGQA